MLSGNRPAGSSSTQEMWTATHIPGVGWYQHTVSGGVRMLGRAEGRAFKVRKEETERKGDPCIVEGITS